MTRTRSAFVSLSAATCGRQIQAAGITTSMTTTGGITIRYRVRARVQH